MPSNYSDQKFKTKVSEIKNNYYGESISNNGSDASLYRHEYSNRSSIGEEQNGVRVPNNRSNLHVEDENLCPKNLSTLVGRLLVNATVPKMEEVEKELSVSHGGWVKNGGCWNPTECKARVKMALIIPYRNRQEQLSIFVRHLHPMLKKQNVDYRIFVIEQAEQTPFNRAMLFNIGFNESLKFDQYECFVFHDVDLIPEDDRNEYSCPSSPRHMSVAVDTFKYLLPYENIFGGVGSFTREHFELINGFSNEFWGWGGEDDDLFRRITAKGLKLKRPAMQVGRYKMLKVFHFRSHGGDPNRVAKLHTSAERMSTDGLNSLKYAVQQVTVLPLYTIVTADVKDAMEKTT
ncbi:hypothetical protein ACROYT_G028865 [Oculina patagonica]